MDSCAVQNQFSILKSRTARAYGDQCAAARRSGASVETVDSCASCVRTRSASTLGECAVLRRMGYMLAKPCRKCGCGIAVPSRDEKDEKDVAGVDEHSHGV